MPCYKFLRIKMGDEFGTPELMGLKNVKKEKGKIKSATISCFTCGEEIELVDGKPLKIWVQPSKNIAVGVCSEECNKKARLMLNGSGEPEKMYG